jgi:hypothetical protein
MSSTIRRRSEKLHNSRMMKSELSIKNTLFQLFASLSPLQTNGFDHSYSLAKVPVAKVQIAGEPSFCSLVTFNTKALSV